MFRFLFSFIVSLVLTLPCYAQGTSQSLGWNSGVNSSISVNEAVLTPTAQPALPQSRYVDVGSGLTKTDNGAGSSFVIGLGPVLTYFYNTGATTQQSAVNAILQFSGVSAGDIVYYNGTNWVRLAKGANGTFLGINGSGALAYGSPAGSGTVTSVDVAVPTWLSVSGGPINSSGTITIGNGSSLSNYYVVGTNGSGALDLRALDANHIPNLDVAKITSGAFAKARQHAATVYNDASNTFSTGTQDLSAAGVVLKLPTDAPATGGAIAYRSNKIQWHNGTSAQTAANEARQISAGTGLTGGGDLSADRTISLSTPVTAANGGSGIASYTSGDLIYASGTTTLSKLGIGLNGQYLKVVSGAPVWADLPASGLMKAAAITSSARALPTSGSISGTYIHSGNLTSANTYTVASGTRIYLKGNLTWGHTVTVSNGIGGGAGSTATNFSILNPQSGAGFSPGTSVHFAQGEIGGAGGGCGGAGGNGGSDTAGEISYGGKAYTIYDSFSSSSGSGGGGNTSAGGDGGAAGGSLYIEVDGNVTLNESITAAGAAGSAGGGSFGSGGGGGAGGIVVIRCTGAFTLASTKSISCTGGNGGSASSSSYGKGAGGGGGIIQVWAGGTLTNSGSFTVTAGSAGSTGSTTTNPSSAGNGTTESISSTAPISLF